MRSIDLAIVDVGTLMGVAGTCDTESMSVVSGIFAAKRTSSMEAIESAS